MAAASSFLLLLLMAALPGKMAAAELVESGGGLSTPGGSLSLLCKASGFNSASSAILWVRQRPGKGLEWVGGGGHHGGTVAPAFRSRLAVSGDDFRGTWRLRLDNLGAEDTATYFCAKADGHGAAGPAERPGKKI